MIKLELEIDEVNQILDALGDQPFKTVFNLIAKIQQQAGAQLQQDHQAIAKQVNELNTDQDQV